MAEALSEQAKKKPGRPPGRSGVTMRNIRMVQKMYAEHAQEALDTYLEVMRDPDVEPAVRIKAAKDITDRAFGTPVSTKVVEQTLVDNRESPVNAAQISDAATEELQVLANVLTKYLQESSDAKSVIDVTPELPENYPSDDDKS